MACRADPCISEERNDFVLLKKYSSDDVMMNRLRRDFQIYIIARPTATTQLYHTILQVLVFLLSICPLVTSVYRTHSSHRTFLVLFFSGHRLMVCVCVCMSKKLLFKLVFALHMILRAIAALDPYSSFSPRRR
ncbi:hypothetical protein TSAR_010978 [Trichomalopsis sarcophagae]|uniref:Uncharacterized protein n=1 Tax=Trichomalopsis sarcophagae TaxID=543379 RepID=A0A232EVM1_9HYME|nr:hypothetical protein TSAR_010978 [Trichomalopsis sarcophagae]